MANDGLTEEYRRRVTLVQSLLYSIYIEKPIHKTSIYRLIDCISLLFREPVAIVVYKICKVEGRVKPCFYSIQSHNHISHFQERVNKDKKNKKLRLKISNTSFSLGIYNIDFSEDTEEKFSHVSHSTDNRIKLEVSSLKKLWALLSKPKDSFAFEFGLEGFLESILQQGCSDKQNQDLHYTPPMNSVPVEIQRNEEFLAKQESNIIAVLEEIYLKAKQTPLITRNGFHFASILFYINSHIYPSRTHSSYNYPLKIIIPPSQLEDIKNIFILLRNAIRTNGSIRYFSYTFDDTEKPICYKNKEFIDYDAIDFFWKNIETDEGIETLLDILQQPFTTRSFTDDSIVAGITHWHHPWSTEFGALQRYYNNSSVIEKNRIIIVYYLCSVMTRNNDEDLIVKTHPTRIGGTSFITIACPFAQTNDHNNDSLFNLPYYIYSYIIRDITNKLRSNLKTTYLNQIKECVIDSVMTTLKENYMLKKEVLLSKLNASFLQLALSYPFESLSLVVKNEGKSINDIKTISTNILGDDFIIELQVHNKNSFYNKKLQRHFNNEKILMHQINSAFAYCAEYFYFNRG